MNCLKCGRETEDREVFCPRCLEEMAAQPVAPGTPVSLPRRPKGTPDRKADRRKAPAPPTPEQQLPKLRRIIRNLAVTVAVLGLVLCLCVFALVRSFFPPEAPTTQTIGQNYNTMTGSPIVSRETIP